MHSFSLSPPFLSKDTFLCCRGMGEGARETVWAQLLDPLSASEELGMWEKGRNGRGRGKDPKSLCPLCYLKSLTKNPVAYGGIKFVSLCQ